MWQRLKQMLIKEFLQVLRDKRALVILILPPMIQTLIFGYAATYEINHVPIVVLDQDNSQQSRELISRFAASPYFSIRRQLSRRDEITDTIERGNAIIAVHIHAGFAQKLKRGETAPVQAVVDGVNSNTAMIALGYVGQIAERYAAEQQQLRLARTQPLKLRRSPASWWSGAPGTTKTCAAAGISFPA